MFYVDALIRWSQYSWDHQAQYYTDVGILSSAYLSLSDDCRFTGKIFRTETTPETTLKFYSGQSISHEKIHECWTKDIRVAKRFLAFNGGYLLERECVFESDILFDVEVLCRSLPQELKMQYSDLQDTEREIVLRKIPRN